MSWDWNSMDERERVEWTEALTEADRRWEWQKTHEQPMSLEESLLEHGHKRRVLS